MPPEPGGPLRQDQNPACFSTTQEAHSHPRLGTTITEGQEDTSQQPSKLSH